MSRFKIVVFLLAVGIAGSIIATSYWYYTRVLKRDTTTQKEITQLQKQKANLPDPGVRRFEKAIEQLRSNDLEGGREALYELMKTFKESSVIPEARRIVGEMNMDMLFSREKNTAATEYKVQPRDGLAKIAGKHQTTIECILRANGMQTAVLQPGDKLLVFPVEFDIAIDVSAKTLWLMRKGVFFKEYQAIDIKLPPGMRVPADLKIAAKSAWLGGKQVNVLSPEFVEAEKSLNAEANRVNLPIRALPRAKPVAPAAAPVAPKAPTGKGKGKKGAANPAAADDDDPVEQVVTGVFLAREDVEELYTIIRTQTPVKVVR